MLCALIGNLSIALAIIAAIGFIAGELWVAAANRMPGLLMGFIGVIYIIAFLIRPVSDF